MRFLNILWIISEEFARIMSKLWKRLKWNKYNLDETHHRQLITLYGYVGVRGAVETPSLYYIYYMFILVVERRNKN